jgi:ABC-2 type transport system permease protein
MHDRATSPALFDPPTKVLSTEAVLRRLFWRLLFRGRAAQHAASHRARKHMGLGASILLFGVFGVVPAVLAPTLETFVFASVLHAYTLMFASLTLAANAGTMLFMKEEAEILLHRPVAPGQLLRAKIAVLVCFALLLALALNAIGMVAGLWSKGATFAFIPAHFVSTVLLMVFSSACIVLVYNLCLKCMGRERLDNVLAGLQSLLAVVMMVGGQILPRVLGMKDFTSIEAFSPWALALPPVWFGALDSVISGSGASPRLWLAAGTAVAATALVSWMAFGVLGSAYGKGLMALNEMANPVESPTRPRGKRLKQLLNLPLLRWWLRDPTEKQAFMLTTAYMFRDREMKLRLYPGIAPLLVMPFIMLLTSSSGDRAERFSWLQSFMACYMGIIPLQAMLLLQRSEHWRATALFHIAPLPHWAPLFHGTRKAVLAMLTLPMLVLQSVVMAVIQQSWVPLVMMLPALFFLPAFSLTPALMGKLAATFKAARGTTGSRHGLCSHVCGHDCLRFHRRSLVADVET